MATSPKEPFVGEELIRLRIEAYHVHFVFSEMVLQIGADFSVVSEDGARTKVSPATRQGELSAIWRLIGDKVAIATWGDEVIMLFESGCKIAIPPSKGQIRGSILGRAKTEDGRVLLEDF
jgi:hypothetical protein